MAMRTDCWESDLRLRGVGQDEDRVEVKRPVLRHPGAHRQNDVPRMLAHHVEDRGLRFGAGPFYFSELGRLGHRQPDIQPHATSRRSIETRRAIPTRRERPQASRSERRRRSKQQADGDSGLHPARVEAAAAFPMFDGHQHRAAPFAADAEPLNESQQRPAGSAPRRRSGRRSAARPIKRRDAHQHQRDDQHRLASHPVAEVSKDDAADAGARRSRRHKCRTQPSCRSAGRVREKRAG